MFKSDIGYCRSFDSFIRMPSEEYFFLYLFQIRSKQEHDLKARNFLPPQAADPEMFVIDGRADPARTNGQFSDTPEGELAWMKCYFSSFSKQMFGATFFKLLQ